jgi:hypothetical protein
MRTQFGARAFAMAAGITVLPHAAWTKFPSAPPTKRASRTVTQSGYFDCDIPLEN